MLILIEKEREENLFQYKLEMEILLSTFNKLKTVPTSHIRTVSLVQKRTAL